MFAQCQATTWSRTLWHGGARTAVIALENVLRVEFDSIYFLERSVIRGGETRCSIR